MCEQYKQRLIYDYERYAEMYHNVDEKEIPWGKIKYISIIVYINDLFAELFDEDIEDYASVEEMDDW